MPKRNIDGASIYYETAGSGEPLVLVPGFASGLWSWKYQFADFAKYFRVIAFDPRGVGSSQMEDGAPNSIDRIAKDVAALLDELEIEKANVLGTSFGGFVTQKFALMHPERTLKVVLACTSFGGPKHVLPSMEMLAAFAATRGLNSKERIKQYLTMAFSPDFVRDAPEIVDGFCRLREQNNVPENVYLDQLTSATTFNVSDDISAIKCKTLVLTGDSDTVVPMQNSLNLAAAVPNAVLDVVVGGSHMFFVEQPDRFNTIITAFLKNDQ